MASTLVIFGDFPLCWTAEISTAVQHGSGKNVPKITSVEAIKQRARWLQENVARPTDLRLRKINLKSWTSDVIKALLHGIAIKRTNPQEKSVRYQYSLSPTPDAEALAAVLKITALKLIFDDPRVKTLEHKGGMILRRLFDTFVNDPTLLPLDFQQLIEGNRKSKERFVADFVSGMTDRYAYSYYSRLFEPGFGSLYENV